MEKSGKKLLVLTSTFPRSKDDPVPARFVLDLCKRLAQVYRVVVVAPHDPGAAYEELFGPIKVLRFPYFFPTRFQRLCNGLGILPNIRRGLLPKLQAPFLFLCEYLFIKRVLRRERPDLVHSHWAIPQGLCGAIAIPKTTPHYLTIHSSDLHTLRRFFFGAGVLNTILKRVRMTFVVSDYLGSLLRTMTVHSTGSTRVLPMGVDEIFYSREKGGSCDPLYHILYVGKLIEVKGVDVLIDAMAWTIRQMPQIKLTIIGDGPLRGRLERKAEALGLLNRSITFSGQVPNHLLPDLLREADAVVVPSIVTRQNETEGMPVVILESMASGLPVLASDVGGLGEVVKNHINGFLFPHSRPDILSAAIERLYAPHILSRLKEGARRSGMAFSWNRIADQYIQAFESPC